MNNYKMIKKMYYCSGYDKAKKHLETLKESVIKDQAKKWLEKVNESGGIVCGTISINKALKVDDLINVLSSAFYGGISYWAVINNDTAVWNEMVKLSSSCSTFEDIALRILLSGDVIELYDVEGEGINGVGLETNPWKLSLKGLLSGIKKHMEISNVYDMDDWDSDDADNVIQYALFDEIIFG